MRQLLRKLIPHLNLDETIFVGGLIIRYYLINNNIDLRLYFLSDKIVLLTVLTVMIP